MCLTVPGRIGSGWSLGGRVRNTSKNRFSALTQRRLRPHDGRDPCLSGHPSSNPASRGPLPLQTKRGGSGHDAGHRQSAYLSRRDLPWHERPWAAWGRMSAGGDHPGTDQEAQVRPRVIGQDKTIGISHGHLRASRGSRAPLFCKSRSTDLRMAGSRPLSVF